MGAGQGIAGLGLAEDIGTGGFNGFTEIVGEGLDEIKFFKGGHGKALEGVNMSYIANWLLQDSGVPFKIEEVRDSLKKEKVLVGSRSYLWGFASRAAPALFVGLLALLIYLIIFGRHPLFASSEILIVMWLLNII